MTRLSSLLSLEVTNSILKNSLMLRRNGSAWIQPCMLPARAQHPVRAVLSPLHQQQGAIMAGHLAYRARQGPTPRHFRKPCRHRRRPRITEHLFHTRFRLTGTQLWQASTRAMTRQPRRRLPLLRIVVTTRGFTSYKRHIFNHSHHTFAINLPLRTTRGASFCRRRASGDQVVIHSHHSRYQGPSLAAEARQPYL